MRLRLIIANLGLASLLTIAGAAPITLALGEPRAGALTSTDTEEIVDTCDRADPAFHRDVYRMEVLPRSEIEVKLSSEFDAYLYLFDSEGELLGENDDDTGTRTSRVSLNVGANEICYAVVTSFAQRVIGNYEITATHPGPEFPTVELQPMVIGQEVKGHLVPGDNAPLVGTERAGDRFHRDALLIEVTEPNIFHIDVEANFDIYLHLTDMSGNIIAENDDGDHHLHSHLSHHAEEAGPLHLVITSFAPLREGVWSYTVTSGWGEEVVEVAPPPPLPGWPIASTGQE